MFRLLLGLITGDFHMHKWEVISKATVYIGPRTRPTHIDYVLQCTVCGNIKRKRT